MIGKFAYSGYKISCYSNLEEKMNEYMWDRVADKMEDQLRKEGAVITNRWPMFPNVVIDRELISGTFWYLRSFRKNFSNIW